MPDRDQYSPRVKRYRTVNALADRAGLDRSDRIDLARAMFNDPGISSYSELDFEELDSVIFALRSWSLIQQIRIANGVAEVEAEVLLRSLHSPTTAELDASN